MHNAPDTSSNALPTRHVLAGLAVLGTIVVVALYRRAQAQPPIEPKPENRKRLLSLSPSGLECDESGPHEGSCYNAAAHRSWVGSHDLVLLRTGPDAAH